MTKSIKKAVNGDVLVAEKGEQVYIDPSNLRISNGVLGEVLKTEANRTDVLIRQLDKAKDDIKVLKQENGTLKNDIQKLEKKFNDLMKVYEEIIVGVLK